MARQVDDEVLKLRAARLAELLGRMQAEGRSQREVADQIGVPASYLSDLRHGRRTVTDPTARRLGEVLGVNFRWLLGDSDDPTPTRAPLDTRDSSPAPATWPPLLAEPHEGEPTEAPCWDGARVELAGVARARCERATHPYVLRVGVDDVRGRLRAGDLLLVSQVDAEAEIAIVRTRGRLVLARPAGDGWERLADGRELRGTAERVAVALGLVWGDLGVSAG